MKRMILMLSILTLTAILLSGCGRSSPTQTWNISPAELGAMLENKDFLLVNVHIPYEAEIPRTDMFVPYNEIEQNLYRFPEDKEAKIVLYCRSGSMSASAADTLVNQGFTNVWNLTRGMIGWESQGYELVHDGPSIGQPRVYFYEDSVDVGKVAESVPLVYTFHFKNVGDALLIIEGVSAQALEGC